MERRINLAVGAALGIALVSTVSSPVLGATACPVTIPNDSRPPPGGGGIAPGSLSTHGNEQLWTILPDDGILRLDETDIRPDGKIVTKFVWWRRVVERTTEVVDGVLVAHSSYAGELAIAGRRLDGSSPPLSARTHPEGVHVGSTLTFAAGGCWEISGRAGSDEMTFIVYLLEPGQSLPDTAASRPSRWAEAGIIVAFAGLLIALLRTRPSVTPTKRPWRLPEDSTPPRVAERGVVQRTARGPCTHDCEIEVSRGSGCSL